MATTTLTPTTTTSSTTLTTLQSFPWALNKLDAEKSIFLKRKMKEYPNRSKILGFIENNMGISFVGHTRYKHLVFSKIETEQDQMKLYSKLYKKLDKHFGTSYRFPKHKWGRIIPNGYMSLSIFHRPTRHALAEGNYIDIDMVCAHPQIVCEICRMNGIANMVLSLKDYAYNSKPYRKEVMELHSVSYDTAKQLPIRLMFGGSYDQWIKDYNVENKSKHPLFVKIEKELLYIMDIVYAHNQHIKKDVLKAEKDKWQNESEAKRGVMGLWAQTIERFIQETSISYLVDDRGFVLEDIVPSQDGFMILPSLWYDEILDNCKTAVMEKYSIEMNFLNKPFDEAIDIPEIEPLDDNIKLIEGGDNEASAFVFNELKDTLKYSAGKFWYKLNNKWYNNDKEVKAIIKDYILNRNLVTKNSK